LRWLLRRWQLALPQTYLTTFTTERQTTRRDEEGIDRRGGLGVGRKEADLNRAEA
jgi:hypothetical protein